MLLAMIAMPVLPRLLPDVVVPVSWFAGPVSDPVSSASSQLVASASASPVRDEASPLPLTVTAGTRRAGACPCRGASRSGTFLADCDRRRVSHWRRGTRLQAVSRTDSHGKAGSAAQYQVVASRASLNRRASSRP